MKWVVGAMVASVLALGCDEGASGGRGSAQPGAGGKADDAEAVEIDPEAQARHIEAVVACEREAGRDRENTSALRYLERTEIESTRVQCLSEANDATRSFAALTLDVTAPEQSSEVGNTFDAWRSGHTLLCSVLIDAHDQALEKSISAIEAACVAESELRLAEAIEAFVNLGGERTELPDGAERYASCYADFDAASGASEEPEAEEPDAEQPESEEPAGDPSTDEDPAAEEPELNGEADATATLADCIEAELEGSLEAVATRVEESFPGRDAQRVRDELEGRYEDASDTAFEVCSVLGYASSDASELQVHRCRVAAAIWRHEVIGHVIPAAGPDADAADPEPPGDGE